MSERRFICVDDAIENWKEITLPEERDKEQFTANGFINFLENFPIASIYRPKSRWLRRTGERICDPLNRSLIDYYVCKLCLRSSPHNYPWCPHCGAEMGGVGE